MTDLLIQERRPRVVDALFELATAAQKEVEGDPEREDVRDYAFSLAWSYHRLRACKPLDRLITKAAAKQKLIDERRKVVEAWPDKFSLAMGELLALQRFVKRQNGTGPIPIWHNDYLGPLKAGWLAPATMAGFAHVDAIDTEDFLEGVSTMLRQGPWAPHGPTFQFRYFADPGQRLEFLAACEPLLKKIDELKAFRAQAQALERAQADARSARDAVEAAWDEAREWKPFPPALGNFVKEVLDRPR